MESDVELVDRTEITLQRTKFRLVFHQQAALSRRIGNGTEARGQLATGTGNEVAGAFILLDAAQLTDTAEQFATQRGHGNVAKFAVYAFDHTLIQIVEQTPGTRHEK